MSEGREYEDTSSADGKGSLSQQYGGLHARGWVDLLPSSWIPYVQLARLSPPVALFLIYFPHLFGTLHAAKAYDLSTPECLGLCSILMGGSFFFSNAAHAWNDIIDAPIDKQIARTRNRPIARGAITPEAAFIFTAAQAFGAALFLLLLPPTTAIATIPTIIGTIYYPWAKRHTYFPQVVLGFCLSWGVIVGNSSAGAQKPWADPAALCLVLALTFWTMIYDTIYAYQDISDDKRVGVKSLAILFQNRPKSLLWMLLLLMTITLISYGRLIDSSIAFYLVTVGGVSLSLGSMIMNVELKNQANCWWWFSCGFWFTAAAIATGLLLEYTLI
ncbi:hypothetical protein M434DRAFT_83975 [Hypoxylon sp. CO27-5]|nr:hypothetical protein M434DRAFT_83975 [Hypoxylon sp. CO27-5]